MSDNNNSSGSKRGRHAIAIVVLCISISGVILISLGTFLVDKDIETAKYIFVAILPLFGTWVGTILAYYFSRENFESASQSVQKMAERLSPMERLKSIPVKEQMRLRKKMVILKLTSQKGEDKVKLHQDILEKLEKSSVNRLPVLDENDHPKYIIHRSMIDQYLAKKVIKDGLSADKLKDITLKNLLDDDANIKELFESSFAIVKEDANLADAKSEMDKLPNCSDVFVTKNGTKNEPVIGWLTNQKIAENAKV